MWWAIPLATTALGMMSAERKADQQRKNNLAAAEQTRYSAWSGLGGGKLDNSYTPSGLEGGLAGGIQGLGIMQGAQAAFGGQQSPWATMSATDQKYMQPQNPYMQNQPSMYT